MSIPYGYLRRYVSVYFLLTGGSVNQVQYYEFKLDFNCSSFILWLQNRLKLLQPKSHNENQYLLCHFLVFFLIFFLRMDLLCPFNIYHLRNVLLWILYMCYFQQQLMQTPQYKYENKAFGWEWNLTWTSVRSRGLVFSHQAQKCWHNVIVGVTSLKIAISYFLEKKIICIYSKHRLILLAL